MDNEGSGQTQSGEPKSILLVEDVPDVRETITDLLEDNGMTIIAAGDGQEAVDEIDKAERVDLLVTDVGLPGPVAFDEVATHARDKFSDELPVVIMSGNLASAEERLNAVKPPREFIGKPFRIADLLSVVRRLLFGTR